MKSRILACVHALRERDTETAQPHLGHPCPKQPSIESHSVLKPTPARNRGGMFFGSDWHLQPHHAKDGCCPHTYDGRWAIGICRGPKLAGKPAAVLTRSPDGTQQKDPDYSRHRPRAGTAPEHSGVPRWAGMGTIFPVLTRSGIGRFCHDAAYYSGPFVFVPARKGSSMLCLSFPSFHVP